MKTISLTLSILITLLLQSCSSTSTSNKYSNSKHYQKRIEVKKDYMNTKEKSFSPKDIKNLLTQKVNLKKPLKIAVVKLGHNNELHTNSSMANHYNSQQVVITPENVNHFESIKDKSKYIKDVTLIPEFIMPENDDFKSLRDVAALMQADLLLVLKTRSYTDYDFNFTKKNEAKAKATIEAVILDVRTGVIPFTSISSNEFLAKKGKNDFSNDELKLRATIGAEDNALKDLTTDIANYFN